MSDQFNIQDAWKRTFDSVPDLIMLINNEYRIICVNKLLAEKLGRHPEELSGLHCFNVFHGTPEPPNFCPHTKLLADGCEHSVEIYEDRFGSYFLVSVTPIYDRDEKLIGSVHVARDISELKRTERELFEKAYDLGERIKELNCLYSISKLHEEADNSLDEMLQKIVDTIPPAWQYPEITCARIVLEDKEFRTRNFRKTIWIQTGNIIIHNKRFGSLEVYYMQEKPDKFEGPFSKEERQLLNAVCERIGRSIEHKKAEEELKKARDELELRVQERTNDLKTEHAFRKAIEESILSGIFVTDLKGRQTYVNRAFCNMVGWSEEELVGTKPPFVYWPPEELKNYKELFQDILNDKIHTGGLELRLLRKNGERFYALILVSPLKDIQGKIIGWVASVGDITSRKKAEELIRKSEASLAEAQRIAHIGNWDWDIQANELQWSYEIYRIFGLNPQGFGATYEAFLDSVHPEDREFVKKSVNEALYGMPYSIDHRIVLPDGTVRVVHEQGEVTFGESGEPVRMLGTVQDITEQKEAEKKLKDSQAKYAAIVEGFDGLVYIYSENHNIEFMNERMIERIGYYPDGQKHTKVLRSFGALSNWSEYENVPGEETVRMEIHNPEDNHWYYIVNTPIHNQDETISRLVMIQDITEKKENEIRLIMSERLSALGQMASGIAHEINNPLATISACTDGLLNRIKKGRTDPEIFENYLKIINEEVIRCKNITTSMLSFVREKTYEKKRIHIDNTLDKTLELIGFQGRLKEVDIIKKYNNSPVVYGSEGELKQVFLSIIMNALDAMEDKGRIEVETGIEDQKVFVKITDDGPGIPFEDLSKIFDPFFTTKSEKGGIGLGLSIANKIIIDNKGKIQVVSDREKGTIFTINLPM